MEAGAPGRLELGATRALHMVTLVPKMIWLVGRLGLLRSRMAAARRRAALFFRAGLDEAGVPAEAAERLTRVFLTMDLTGIVGGCGVRAGNGLRRE